MIAKKTCNNNAKVKHVVCVFAKTLHLAQKSFYNCEATNISERRSTANRERIEKNNNIMKYTHTKLNRQYDETEKQSVHEMH